MLDNLQQSRETDQRFTLQPQRVDDLQLKARQKSRRHRRHLLAAVACAGAVISVFPGALQQLADAPLVSWLLAALGLSLLWSRDA